jgi:hypothetical protein
MEAAAPSPEKVAFVVINVLGGAAVLGSYALWLSNPAHQASALWGAIGGAARGAYVVSMLAAAAGYFAFAPWVLRLDAARVDLTLVNLCFVLVLFPSALWMPLAFEYLAAPGPLRWWAMRGVLLVVGLASLALVVLLARISPAPSGRAIAVAGAVAFTFQTLVLDALVWPRCFPG